MENSLTIYNASAGSGKTYTLVYRVLLKLLATNNPYLFQSILALTFTNKAANEMKERLLNTLHDLSENKKVDLAENLKEDLAIDNEQIKSRSKKVLRSILHDYSNFSVSTIDKFNLRLIRQFAKDLGLSYSFDVELDRTNFYQKSLNRLYESLQSDSLLTKVLQQIVLENLQVEFTPNALDKSVLELVSLMAQDQHVLKLVPWEKWTIKDLHKLRNQIFNELIKKEKQVKSQAEKVVELIHKQGLTKNDFHQKSRGIVPFFERIAKGESKFPSATHYKIIEEEKLAADPSDTLKESQIGEIFADILHGFYFIEKGLKDCQRHRAIIQKFNAFVLLVEFNKVSEELKNQENILLISDFNQIIFNHLRNEPSEFIFEFLGNRYDHYFLDEFQDTSLLQWNNVFPLLSESLSQAHASALLVGDPKQAIYGFRGGDPELMMELPKKNFPFLVNQEKLDTNWRSSENIIQFNNDFFESVSAQLDYPDYSTLYSDSSQKINKKTGGEVAYFTYTKSPATEINVFFFQQLLKLIESAKNQGFSWGDIAILSRNNKELSQIADYLVESTQIKFATDEALLVHKNHDINVFINYLYHRAYPKQNEYAADFLLSYFQLIDFQEDISSFIHNYINVDVETQQVLLKEIGIDIDRLNSFQIGLFDSMEKWLQAFSFNSNSVNYRVVFLNFVLDYSKHSRPQNLKDFLEFWEEKKTSLSLSSGSHGDKIQLMTLHKSKGLQFPVVIIPRANWSLGKGSLVWIDSEEETKDSTLQYPVNFKKDFERDTRFESQVFQEEKKMITEELNLLYVGFTRAVHQLYIGLETNAKGIISGANAQFFNSYFPSISKDSIEYIYKSDERYENEKSEKKNLYLVDYQNFEWDKRLRLATPRTAPKEARSGNILHELLLQLDDLSDVSSALNKVSNSFGLTKEETQEYSQFLNNFIKDKRINELFNSAEIVWKERDFLDTNGQVFRPDVLIKNKLNQWILLDYKTGKQSIQHQKQLQTYASELATLGVQVDEAFLIYFSVKIEWVQVDL